MLLSVKISLVKQLTKNDQWFMSQLKLKLEIKPRIVSELIISSLNKDLV